MALDCNFNPMVGNHMPRKVWDEITYQFPNFNSCILEFWELISYFIPHFIMDVITYPLLGLNLIQVSKKDLGVNSVHALFMGCSVFVANQMTLKIFSYIIFSPPWSPGLW